jgi:hypothetical protein
MTLAVITQGSQTKTTPTPLICLTVMAEPQLDPVVWMNVELQIRLTEVDL